MTYNRRFGAFRPSVRLGKHGAPMRDPNGHDVDITSDLTGGSDDAALADNLPYNGQSSNAQQAAPEGTQHVHGDATHVNNVNRSDAEKQPSLHEALSNAFKGNDGKPTSQEQAQSVQPANAQTPAPLTKDEAGKYRLADGTFASQEQITAFEGQQQQNNTSQQQAPAFVASLTAQEAQQFQSLPAELRQYVERTMEDVNTRKARYSEYDTIEQQLIGPRREAFAAQGTNPVVALNQLFALSDFAGRDPGNFVLWFSQQNGIDLDALLDARDAATANTDPVVRELQGQVQQLTGTLQQMQQGSTQQVQQANLDAVRTFAEATDNSGALARPYITDVMDDWAAQITAVRNANPQMPNEQVLQRAYENACWSNPTIRGKMQEASANAQRAAEAARVAAAKAASGSVAGGPAGNAGASTVNSDMSLRESLEAQFTAARAV